VRGGDVQRQLLHERSEPGSLAFGQVQDEPRQPRGVDDRMLERAFQTATDEPGVERIVTVLDEHRALRETEECPAGVPELGRPDQHRAVDVVTPFRIGVDGCAAVDQRVEERERAVQFESLGADFEDEERRVARRLHVQGDELRVIKLRAGADLRGVDRDLLPRHGLRGAAGLEQDRSLGHLAKASALRANAISSAVTARSSRAAPP